MKRALEPPENAPLKQPKQEEPDDDIQEQLEQLELKSKKRAEKIVKLETDDGDFLEEIDNLSKIHAKWANLPLELRELCLKELDLKSRFNLSRTCRYERFSMLRKHPIRWKSIEIKFNQVENQRFFEFIAKPHDKSVPEQYGSMLYHYKTGHLIDSHQFTLLRHLLHTGIVQNLRLEIGSGYKLANTLVTGLKSATPLRFANFWGYAEPEKAVLFFLQNCETKIDKIHLFGHRFHASLNSELWNVVKVEKFHTARHIQIDTKHTIPSLFSNLAQKWIDSDAPIGTKLLTKNVKPDGGHDFCTVFKERICELKSTSCRISTNNPAKHIVLDARPRGKVLMSMYVTSATSTPAKKADFHWLPCFDGNFKWSATK